MTTFKVKYLFRLKKFSTIFPCNQQEIVKVNKKINNFSLDLFFEFVFRDM